MEGCPRDLFYYILKLSGYRSICRASQVCRLWNEYLGEDQSIWEHYCWTLRVTPQYLQLPLKEKWKTIWTIFLKKFRSTSEYFPVLFPLLEEIRNYSLKHVEYLSCTFQSSMKPFHEALRLKGEFKNGKEKCPRDLLCWYLLCDDLHLTGTRFLQNNCELHIFTPTFIERFEVLKFCNFDSKDYYYVLNPRGEGAPFKRGNIVCQTPHNNSFTLVTNSFQDFLVTIIKSLGLLNHMPYEKIKQMLQDLYERIDGDENIDARELEALNIECDRLSLYFETIQEYLQEQELIHLKWKKENELINGEAFEVVLKSLKEMNEEQLSSTLEEKPDLKVLFLSPQEMSQYGFESINTTNCSLLEKRAIYFHIGELDIEIVRTKMFELMELISAQEDSALERQKVRSKASTKKPFLLPSKPKSTGDFLGAGPMRRKRID
eukprot:TRINITY_DN2521_c0_g1_i10.p1 TRINITY_DN2521_c0_g1~~TRINITY_DN2521_c0_g1_i10.p1  ORF type:complete len:432 (+),score=84.59 TRINITY_DN2521_c0_g1_i10:26-1321(+)